MTTFQGSISPDPVGHPRRALFGREHFTLGLSWQDIGPLLPGWEIVTSPPAKLADHLEGVDVVCPFGAAVDAAVLEAGSFGLVQQFGVGLDKVDIDKATALGVWVSRLPGDATGNADSVAELAMLHILALAKRLDDARAHARAGEWGMPAGRSMLDATVVIVGLGAIGTAVARRLAPFGAHLVGVRARPALGGPPEVAEVVGPGDMARVLGGADVVVCCAMFDGTNGGMFDAAAFGALKPGAIFVNVARGGLVDEEALLDALESGQVCGAGLDVFANEPVDPDHPLVNHPRVLATPHVGGITEAMFHRSAMLFAENVLRWAGGDQPMWAVNEPVLARRGGVAQAAS
ncbi:MAG: NAD(P)-dependent oxidoreductase [Acidimicrobiales bacterium]